MNSMGPYELQILFCAIALGIVQILLMALFNVAERGLPWGVGPRDDAPKPFGKFGARNERALHNFMESFVLFAAAVLLVNALGRNSATSAHGAELYIWGRVLYLPLYLLGIPWLRTIAWGVALAGILMVMAAVWPGM